MLNRTLIKKNIRNFLSIDKCWVDMLIAGIVPILLGFLSGGFSYKESFDGFFSTDLGYSFNYSVNIIGLVAFLCTPITIAFNGYVLNKIRGFHPQQADVYKEAGNHYGKYLLTYLLQTIFTVLWTILFIIPGIIAALSYSMTNFIIHDNPNLPATDAIALSKRITKGYKGDILILYLSFIPWYLLVFFTFGIATIYVTPYVTATSAAFYEELKRNAIQNGIASPLEFGMVPVEQVNEEFDFNNNNNNNNNYTNNTTVQNDVEPNFNAPYAPENEFNSQPINHESPINPQQDDNSTEE